MRKKRWTRTYSHYDLSGVLHVTTVTWDDDMFGFQRDMSKAALDHTVSLAPLRTAPPSEVEARHGYQEIARLPCYRGVRTR